MAADAGVPTQSSKPKTNAENICVSGIRHFAKRTICAGAVLEPVDKFQIGKIHKRHSQLRPQIVEQPRIALDLGFSFCLDAHRPRDCAPPAFWR
jgi:hypothetical protein